MIDKLKKCINGEKVIDIYDIHQIINQLEKAEIIREALENAAIRLEILLSTVSEVNTAYAVNKWAYEARKALK